MASGGTANFAAGQVRAFTNTGGIPTGVSGNPFASGLSEAVHGVVDPGRFYMVADRTGNRVGVYQIGSAGSTTTLTAVSGSPYAAGGTFTESDNRVGVYRISGSGSSTTLSAVGGSPFSSGGLLTNALALTSDGGLLLAANGDSRNLTIFRGDTSTGGLTFVRLQATNTLGASGVITGLAFAMGALAAFTDDPLAAGTLIKAAHVAELRSRIDAVRARYGLAAFPYTDPIINAGTTTVKAVHITQLRLALQDVYDAAVRTRPTYTDPGLGAETTPIVVAHIDELRSALTAIE